MTQARQQLKIAAETHCWSESIPQVLRRLGRHCLTVLAHHARVYGSGRRRLRGLKRWATSMPKWELYSHLIEAAFLSLGQQGTKTIYVSTVSGDNSDGTTWAKAFATVTLALAQASDASTNIILVDSAHAGSTGANITWIAATASSLNAIISVNRNGSTTTGHAGPLAGATETINANTFTFNMFNSIASTFYMFGMTCVGNSGASANNFMSVGNGSTATINVECVSCTFTIPGTSTSVNFTIGNATTNSATNKNLTMRDCTVNISNSTMTTGAIVVGSGKIRWINTTVGYAGGSKPTSLFSFGAGRSADFEIFDSDLSGFNTTSGHYFLVTNFYAGTVVASCCKISATPDSVSGTWVSNAASITLINWDSGAKHNVLSYYNRLGTLTVDTGIYANTGVQFDQSSLSWKIVTTSLCSEQEPFITPLLRKWMARTGAFTFTVEMAFDNATEATDRTHWVEFGNVLENASFPVGTSTTTRNAQPFDGTGTTLTTSTETWTGTSGFTNEKKRKISSSSRTLAKKCYVVAGLRIGVASWTGYVDSRLRAA